MRTKPSLLLFLSFVVVTAPALASDGVLEINQTCAVSSGCFAGDTAGLPVTITTPGSYRLTSNRAISVRNGTITGMGANGVDLGEQADLRDLRVRWNRVVGFEVSNGSTVSGVTAYQNGSSGIDANPGSTITGNTAYDNGSDGIHSFSGSTVRSNTVYGNDDDGIEVSAAANISDNTSYQNSDYGIATGAGATVSGNAVFSNFGGGISAGSGSLVQGNAIRHNSTWGLVLFSTSGYGENVITTQFSAGTVTGGVDLGGNLCDGATVCP